MDRRDVIKNIALASTATIFLTGCADRNVIEFLSDDKLLLDQRHKDYLARISEAFLPISDVSEKIGNPVEFAMSMINDCASPDEVQNFANGFEQYKQLMKESRLKIKKADPDRVVEVVEQVLEVNEPSPQLVHFINTVKGLSIYNLKSSEYYMTEYVEYGLIPDAYNACIDV